MKKITAIMAAALGAALAATPTVNAESAPPTNQVRQVMQFRRSYSQPMQKASLIGGPGRHNGFQKPLNQRQRRKRERQTGIRRK